MDEKAKDGSVEISDEGMMTVRINLLQNSGEIIMLGMLEKAKQGGSAWLYTRHQAMKQAVQVAASREKGQIDKILRGNHA